MYAGVLGKLIGVYLGRPFEGWTHQKIMEVLGPIRNYVHDHPNMPALSWDPAAGSAKDCGLPLVVTDDDVSGTFTFVRALEEHGFDPEITSEQIGKTWLNQIIEGQTILWWGGRGVSTEHTAYLNLKDGIPGPRSGSIGTNGKTVAEQIGAQIFIDGWAMVAPGRPELAARLARAAGSVSHDGESVNAAVLWAAMEAEAFVSKDVNHLLDTGLKFVREDSAIAALIADVRQWHASDGDWLRTRQRIEDKYGYDKYCGVCHVMPNHGIMIMALLYGGHDFTEAMHIINTCGWDTDCNSGNVGCLVALMHGMDAFEGSVDWRGPIADRALISSADGGFSIANAASLAFEVANLGRRLGGHAPLSTPKGGAQFHFSLPGSVQGFRSSAGAVAQEYGEDGNGILGVSFDGLSPSSGAVEVVTDTFMGKEVLKMPTYPLMASPLVYPGQTLGAKVRLPAGSTTAVLVAIRLKVYSPKDELQIRDSEPADLQPGEEKQIELTIADDLDSQPIQAIGIAVRARDATTSFTGKLLLDSLGWTGAPNMVLKKPPPSDQQRPGAFWLRAWVKAVDEVYPWARAGYLSVVQNRGSGLVAHGTRDWTDYRAAASSFTVQLGRSAGVAVRVRGVNRYYALVLDGGGTTASLVKALDGERIVLARAAFAWGLDVGYEVVVEAVGPRITGRVGGVVVLAGEDAQFGGGGVGLVVEEGALAVGPIRVEPCC